MELEQVNIKRELVASNLILNRLLTKVEVLETNSKNNNLNSTMANQYIDSSFFSLFPINDIDAFLIVELNIVNEVDFVLKLVCNVYKTTYLNFKFLILISSLILMYNFRNHSLKVLMDLVLKII